MKYFTEQCLCSVRKAIDFFDEKQATEASMGVEVILIDNNSTDNSYSYLQPLFPWIKLIQNKSNTGYAVANNQGWKLALGEYILFLNPDTLMAEDCLLKAVSFMKQQPDAGALGVHMIDGSGNFLRESKRGFPSPLASFYKLSGLCSLFPQSKHFAAYYSGHLPETKNNAVDVLSGAFMLVKKSVLEKTGGFDEQFFMYAEDIDLSYRIKKEGFENYYLASTTLIHFKGESTRKDIKYVKLFYKAMILFVKKHYSGSSSFLLRSMLQLAIWIKGFIAGLEYLLPVTPMRKPPSLQKLVVLSTQNEENEVLEIMEHYPQISLVLPKWGENQSIFQAHELVDGSIFVAGTQCYSEIINQMKQFRGERVFCFHAAGSKSIVSSYSKRSNGEVFTKP